ncbi:MAG: SDR family NAD(P)-dependent oxidoreductase [Chloroflexi bacterium]|nr:SDR family NAD(P)-dependent oxidoreductase [Chloroflexota bacterium]
MPENILITGGAGFIGSHIADALIERGHQVRVLDALVPQVHEVRERPTYLNPKAELVVADVCDRDAVRHALDGVDVLFHEAAAVGVGQSMYEIQHYVEANTLGGAILLDVLANEDHTVRKVIVASSMSIYGEGAYRCLECGPVFPRLREGPQLSAREWEMRCPECGQEVVPEPTPEDKPLAPTSVYAVTKRDHEEMFLCVGQAYGIPAVALRYFNVYGPRQALSNPYTGVAAIFSSRLLNDNPPVIYEDGLQSRDFVHVSDIVQANLLAMERPEADYQAFNVGTGYVTTVLDVARLLSKSLGKDIAPRIEGRFRQGDIRHCFADISKIRRELGYEPQVRFREGVPELVNWVRQQTAEDRFEQVEQELAAKSLVV